MFPSNQTTKSSEISSKLLCLWTKFNAKIFSNWKTVFPRSHLLIDVIVYQRSFRRYFVVLRREKKYSKEKIIWRRGWKQCWKPFPSMGREEKLHGLFLHFNFLCSMKGIISFQLYSPVLGFVPSSAPRKFRQRRASLAEVFYWKSFC